MRVKAPELIKTEPQCKAVSMRQLLRSAARAGLHPSTEIKKFRAYPRIFINKTKAKEMRAVGLELCNWDYPQGSTFKNKLTPNHNQPMATKEIGTGTDPKLLLKNKISWLGKSRPYEVFGFNEKGDFVKSINKGVSGFGMPSGYALRLDRDVRRRLKKEALISYLRDTSVAVIGFTVALLLTVLFIITMAAVTELIKKLLS